MTTLYEIRDSYKSLLELDIDEQTLADTLESIDDEFADKAENICYLITELNGRTDIMKAEVKRLNSRIKVMENKAASLSSYLQSAMEATDKKKIVTDRFTVTHYAGRDICLIKDEAKIPKQWKSITESVKINKKIMLDYMKDGNPIEGAEVGTGNPWINIK